ncbi:protein-arginine deiminase domain-containing protein [Streptomyces yaizuensis]|uniref:Protein-arginine deiminase domain-containing protein n=2 Tax=Streptomyces yaizuensis TaxID=2989713 RepID=A0ABQ5P223_9ACTN|nr:protein-arginine deiminase domain-containing protein [Streptomyces sp. YSPA8]GLF96641.1 protein-arginine deiminase domain-containing protein [Streptomyces sp. YSPA8]
MGSQRWKSIAVATGVAGALVGTMSAPASATGEGRAAPAPAADLRADVNRDGRVDTTGTSDNAGEDTWTKRRGAVVLPNIDDDQKDCPTRDSSGRPLTDAELARCNDAADTVVNGPHDAADLARLRTVPMPGVAAGTTATIEIDRTPVPGLERGRLFIDAGGGWRHLTPSTVLDATALRWGVELGIEATDVVRSPAWDGTLTVRFTVTAPDGRVSYDTVKVRVAPVLTHHHRQRAQQVVVSKLVEDYADAPWLKPAQNKFVRELAPVAKKAGITKPLKVLETNDIWAQDFVEPGYTSMTGPNGKPHTLRVMIRSAQPNREAGRELFTQMRGRDIGVVQFDGPADLVPEWTLNSMGNLETIPPYAHQGKEYPAGRIIMGQWGEYGLKPAKPMTDFLSAQGMQSPLLLDTNWLAVGHVDEFVQFLPAKTARGWRIAVSDPKAGLDVLRKAKAEGHGGKRLFSVPGVKGRPAPKVTIDQALADRKFLADNQYARARIEANLRLLRKETGVTEAETVRVPGLFSGYELPDLGARTAKESGKASGKASGKDGVPGIKLGRIGADVLTGITGDSARKSAGAVAPNVNHTVAYIPGAVNGVVLSDKDYLSAKQWGPVINGVDVFGKAVSAAYQRAGFKTVYLDDYNSYHFGGGEVHCGTNTLRDTSAPWWRQP